jgi:hypothetical protein
VCFAAALVVSGCSSDGGDDATPTPPTTTAAGGVTTVDPGAPSGPRPTVTTTTIAPVVTIPEDDLAPAEQPYVTAIAEAAGEGVDRCSIVQFVDLVGADRLDGAGLDPADPPTTGFDSVLFSLELSADEAGALHDLMVACGHDFVGEMVDDLVAGRTDDPAVVSCLRARIDPSAVRDTFVGALQGIEFDESAFDGLAACFDA